MKSEVETTIENYKKIKNEMLKYAKLTSNENIRIIIESFVKSADAYIDYYNQIKEYKGRGEILTTDRIIYEKVDGDKYMNENLKSSLEEQLNAMNELYKGMKKENVNDKEGKNYEITLKAMYYTIFLFENTIGIAIDKKGNGFTREIVNMNKRKRNEIDYI